MINYYRFGTGPRVVLCFHGYGEDGRSFEFLGSKTGNSFSFYALDLPFHGKTRWLEGLNFSNDDLREIIQLIGQKENFSLAKIYLMGFSLGGRVALSTYQLMTSKIEKIILLAPDGLKINFWYWLSTQTWAGNRFFGFTMKHPGWFTGFLKLINKLGWVNSSIYKFVNYYISDKEVRHALYNRWTGLRKLKPGYKRLKSLIRQYKTPVQIVYGEHDRIIKPGPGQRFKKGIEEYCSIRSIHSGHQVLHEKHAEEIWQALLQ